MFILRKMKIKHKLIAIMTATCVMSLLLTGIVFVLYEFTNIQRDLTQKISTQAKIVADNCKASLAFENSKDAEQILNALRVESSIVFAAIYNKEGKLFASYRRDASKGNLLPSENRQRDTFIKDGYLIVHDKVILSGEEIGTVCVWSDLSPMYRMLKQNVLIVLAILSAGSLIGYFLSNKLQTIISGPILELANVAKNVSDKKEYSIRAVKKSNDEVGILIDSFNEMLKQIHKHEIEMVDINESLEEKVRKRTVELTTVNERLRANESELKTINEQLRAEIAEHARAKQELRKSELRVRAVLESVPEGIIAADLETQCIVFVNESICRMLGYSREELTGLILNDIYPVDDRSSVTAEFDKMIRRESVSALDLPIKQKDGNVFSADVQTSNVELDRRARVLFVFTDITERKQAEKALRESEKRHRLLFDGSRDALMTLAPPSWKFTSGNPAAVEMFGVKNVAEFTDLGPWNVSPERQPDGRPSSDKAKEMIEKAMCEGSNFFEWTHKKLYGEDFPATVLLTRVEMAGQVFLQATVRDITVQKRAEEALVETNRELEELNKRLKFIIHKLRQSNQQLQDFVYIASHDLREPVRKIASFGQLLTESLSGKLGDDDQENFNFMIDGAARMQQMIEALLVYSRITTKAAEFVDVNLEQVIEQIRTFELSVALEETGGQVSVEGALPVVKGDPAQVRQLMQNLIGNALKYHKKEIAPQITIRACSQNDDMIRVEVEDNGIGIKAEHFENVFVMFRRLHSRQEYEGTGIGLAVCKKIVERHNGQIGVDSVFGQGTTFWFTLPALEMQDKKEKDTKLIEV